MRIGPLGPREIVPLALLIVAIVVAISVTLLRDDNSAQRAASERLNPTPTATATPDFATVPVPKPSGWLIRFGPLAEGTTELLEGPVGSTADLNLEYPGAPFPDLRDDAWGVSAEASITAGTGMWQFEIEYQGRVIVSINDTVVAQGQSRDVATLVVAAVRDEGMATLKIEGIDEGGAFLLRWP